MQHPSDEEWLGGESAEHRANCASCRAEQERLEGALAGFRELAKTAADRPDYFWDRQRLAIHARLQAGSRIPHFRTVWVWAAAAALVMVLGLIFYIKHTPPPVPDIAAGHDQELLLAIDRSINSELPEVLQPALVLTQELDNAASRSIKK
jgi:hypothetical protein